MSDTPEEEEEEEEESSCGRPCPPDADCDECKEYWAKMTRMGLWDRQRGRWTESGWNSITRSI